MRNQGHVGSGTGWHDAGQQGFELGALDLNSVPGWIILKTYIIWKIHMTMLLEGHILSKLVYK